MSRRQEARGNTGSSARCRPPRRGRGRPAATVRPNARMNPSGARSCVPLICGLPAITSSTRLPGLSGSMPNADTISNRSSGSDPRHLGADQRVDEAVVLIEHAPELPALRFRHVAKCRRIGVAQEQVPDRIDRETAPPGTASRDRPGRSGAASAHDPRPPAPDRGSCRNHSRGLRRPSSTPTPPDPVSPASRAARVGEQFRWIHTALGPSRSIPDSDSA